MVRQSVLPIRVARLPSPAISNKPIAKKNMPKNMPHPNKRMHDFLLRFMHDPRELVNFEKDPVAYISESNLSNDHKEVLLSGDVHKIKSTVNESIGDQQFYPHIKPQATAFHIVIKSIHHSIKLSLRPKSSKSRTISYNEPSRMEAFAIHITSSTGGS